MQSEIREKVLKIMELATLINSTATTQELTGDKPTVFVNFSGHCCFLTVYIYRDGWSYDGDLTFICDYANLNADYADAKLSATISELQAMLDEIDDEED